MNFVDSHAHLTHGEKITDDELLRAKEANVTAIINICTDERSLKEGFILQEEAKSPKIYTATATTPHDVAKDGDHFFPIVEKAAFEKRLVAIGETGLDYYYEHSPRDIQKQFLRKYLKLAKKYHLPVVIHCRDAFADFFSIWDEEKPAHTVLHCFTGTVDEVDSCLKRGMYISFSGIITFPKSVSLREAALRVPQDRLLIETDAPYLAPQAFRGKKNESSYIVETAKVLAELKGVSLMELGESTSKNAQHVFQL